MKMAGLPPLKVYPFTLLLMLLHDLQLWCQIMLAVGFVTWPTTVMSETDRHWICYKTMSFSNMTLEMQNHGRL